METSGEHSALVGIRWQILHALRDVAAGTALIVQVDPQTARPNVVIFDGQPLPQLAGSVLLGRQWVQPERLHWMANSTYYGLSPSGVEALNAGLRWWRSLPYLRRLLLRLSE